VGQTQQIYRQGGGGGGELVSVVLILAYYWRFFFQGWQPTLPHAEWLQSLNVAEVPADWQMLDVLVQSIVYELQQQL